LVETKEGLLEGKILSPNVECFLGVPYAEAPVGNLRFKPPKKKSTWKGILPAKDYRNSAYQKLVHRPSLGKANCPNKVSEDCLYLNIWRPSSPISTKLPVMFWIHGGANVAGSGSLELYDATNIVENGNIIVISIHYRLSILGFTNFGLIPNIDHHFKECLNLGLQDQLAALVWVHQNIAAFGGDPMNVTLVGQSAGASAITNLMACPHSHGLFNRVILQSLPLYFTKPLNHSMDQALKILDLLNIKVGEAKKLLDISCEDLLDIQEILFKDEDLLDQVRTFGASVDNCFISEIPFVELLQRVPCDVEIMIGWTKDEWQFFRGLCPNFNAMTSEQAKSILQRIVGKTKFEEFWDHYRSKTFYPAKPAQIISKFLTDQIFVIPSLLLAENWARKSRKKVFVYEFAWETRSFGGILGSPHVAELPFTFNNLSQWKDVPMMKGCDLSELQPLANRISLSWINFIKHGDPNHSSIPCWAPYFHDAQFVLSFDDEVDASHSFAKELFLWKEIPLINIMHS